MDLAVKEKPCSGKNGCGKVLPLQDFNPDKKGKHGRRSICKKCNNAHSRRLNENPEIKAKRRAACKAWNAKNTDRLKAYDKAYYKANTDKVKANVQAWREQNPEKLRAAGKAWNAKNPGYIQPIKRAGYETGYVVYVIEDYDGEGNGYVGQTCNVYNRIAVHKHKGILNTDSYKILAYCKTREEALEIEAYYHSKGYHGAGVGDNFWKNKYRVHETI